VFLNGWQAHDDFGNLDWPEGLHRDLRRRFGSPALGPEIFGPQNVRTLERQLRESVESLDQFARIVVDLLSRERWDLLLAVFGGAHRALHYLWTLDEADLEGADPSRLERLASARETIFEAADRAVGTVLRSAPPDARVVVFALHGMGRNQGWSEHFRDIVSHLHARGGDHRTREGLVYRLKSAIPWTWSRQVTMRLPSSLNHALVPLWSRRMHDWSTTRYFTLPLDLNGYLRVNLKGRDAQGIVDPGAELEALLDELTDDLLALRDLRDDKPIVSDVVRVDDLVGPDAPRRFMLPDLIVTWTDGCASGSPGVRTRYGELRWDPHARLPSGRGIACSARYASTSRISWSSPRCIARRMRAPPGAPASSTSSIGWLWLLARSSRRSVSSSRM